MPIRSTATGLAPWLLAGLGVAWGQAVPPAADGQNARPDPPARAAPPTSGPEPAWTWEGAVGPVANFAPDYSGASTRRLSWDLGYYLRYGRISISNTSGFVTRRNKDDIFRGLGLDLKRDERLRLNVALRLDNGRRSSDVRGLQGVDDVRRTIRARFSATLQFAPPWKATAGLNTDLLGRGGGNVLDLGLSHDRRWSASTVWGVSAAVTAADARYMRSWFGVSEPAAAATGHPVYTPGAGLRDVGIGTSWRMEVDDRWIALWGGSVGRVIGPAARSPLTTGPQQWSINAALARRF